MGVLISLLSTSVRIDIRKMSDLLLVIDIDSLEFFKYRFEMILDISRMRLKKEQNITGDQMFRTLTENSDFMTIQKKANVVTARKSIRNINIPQNSPIKQPADHFGAGWASERPKFIDINQKSARKSNKQLSNNGSVNFELEEKMNKFSKQDSKE